LAGSKNHGYPAINAALKKLETKGTSFYSKVIGNFGGGASATDVNLQLSSLTFLNCMLTSAPDSEREQLFKVFDKQSLTKHLRPQLGTADSVYPHNSTWFAYSADIKIKLLDIWYEKDSTM
jgi:hypothetical protein